VREPDLSWIAPHLAVAGRFACRRARDLLHGSAIRAAADPRIGATDDEVELARRGVAFLPLPTHRAAVDQAMLDAGVERSTSTQPLLSRGPAPHESRVAWLERRREGRKAASHRRGFDGFEAVAGRHRQGSA